MNLFEAIIIAIVEGLTEFLPVSSTGHMIIASSAFGIGHEDFTKIFEVSIQLGAILAVVVLYWKKFFHFTRYQFYLKLLVSVIPALFFGFLFNDFIDQMLGSPVIVAVSLVLGGIVLLFVDNWFPQAAKNEEQDILAHHLTKQEVVEAEEKLSFKKAFIIGFWQVLAMIPGVSRSAASIIGGMQQKLSRNFAAEFSFFLAVPTMFAATIYSLVMKDWGEEKQKGYEVIMASQENITAFVVGNVVAFVVALLAIKFFIGYLQKHGFRLFGWYRIIAGIILLALAYTGYLT
ncbi:undecaprenyl-diphosphate phosphatase [Flavisolibacter sp. BT320]|nr:undecaprenyl-diphosphate phosphatase [Flavisolibacter longurius]